MTVTVCMIGGLGNQMFEYACGRALALRLGADLQLETSNVDADPIRDYALGHFQGIKCPLVKEPQGRVIKYWGMDYHPEIFDGIDGDVTLRGYFQSWKYFSDVDAQIRKDLTLRSIEISREAIKMSYKCGTPDTVAVHVRMGDYKSDATKAVMGMLPPTYYEEAIELIQQAEKTKMQCFIFSDEIDEAVRYLEIKPHKRITLVRGMSEIEDLWLMACCRHMILANSSFSWWSAYGNMRGGIKVAPKKWLVEIKSDDLCPANWIRI